MPSIGKEETKIMPMNKPIDNWITPFKLFRVKRVLPDDKIQAKKSSLKHQNIPFTMARCIESLIYNPCSDASAQIKQITLFENPMTELIVAT